MWKRLWQHLHIDHFTVRRMFPPEALDAIERATREAETGHAGELRFVIEASLPLARVWTGLTPRERALEVFGLQRVWDTADNCGVLIYLLLADRDVEIVADRGIHARVGEEAWRAICDSMEQAFRAGRYVEGAIDGIRAAGRLMAEHFPAAVGRDELSNRPVVL